MTAMIATSSPLKPPIDRFVYRLLAAISLGIGVLAWGLAYNMRYQRIPNLQHVITSLHIDDIGRAGEWLFAYGWVVGGIAAGGVGVSLAAIIWTSRPALGLAYMFNFATIALSVANEVAASRVWTRVLSKLMS